MTDASHDFGSDLALNASGDLLMTASTPDETRQLVLRRLLTNPADYLWHLDYGAGLPRFIGQPARPDRIGAVIRSQMRLERGVARTPAPTIAVSAEPDGTVTARVSYVDATTGTSQTVIGSSGAIATLPSSPLGGGGGGSGSGGPVVGDPVDSAPDPTLGG